jgi:hypothetical protein
MCVDIQTLAAIRCGGEQLAQARLKGSRQRLRGGADES